MLTGLQASFIYSLRIHTATTTSHSPTTIIMSKYQLSLRQNLVVHQARVQQHTIDIQVAMPTTVLWYTFQSDQTKPTATLAQYKVLYTLATSAMSLLLLAVISLRLTCSGSVHCTALAIHEIIGIKHQTCVSCSE